MEERWVLQIKQLCAEQDVAFFFKQWGGVNKKANGRRLLGQEWNNWPVPKRQGTNLFEDADVEEETPRSNL